MQQFSYADSSREGELRRSTAVPKSVLRTAESRSSSKGERNTMQGRNHPRVGRHGVGAPIARSGVRPPNRTGAPGLRSPGARTYKNNMPITSGTRMMDGSRPMSANDYTRQAEQFIGMSPEPFRNSQSSARPMGVPSHPQYRDGLKLRNGGAVVRNIGSRDTRTDSDQLRSVGVVGSPGRGVQGVYSVTSGYPTRNVQSRVGNNRDVPVSKKPRFKTNNDIFGPGLEAMKRYGG